MSDKKYEGEKKALPFGGNRIYSFFCDIVFFSWSDIILSETKVTKNIMYDTVRVIGTDRIIADVELRKRVLLCTIMKINAIIFIDVVINV